MGSWLDVELLILSVRNTLGIQWVQRSGKPRDNNVIPDSSSNGGRQQRTSKEGHMETAGEL